MRAALSTKPTLAFAHANGLPGHSYDTFLAPFAEDYALFVVDQVGHNPEFPVDAGWDGLSRELEAQLAPLPKPIVGLGHSLGSVLMYLVAQRRPEWFSAVVLMDPPMMGGWIGWMLRAAKLTGQIDKVTPAGKSDGRRDGWADWHEVESYFHSRKLFQAFDPRCLRDYLQAGLEQRDGQWRLRFKPEVEVAIFREPQTTGIGMPPLRVPAAVVTGERSPQPFHHGAQRLARRHKMHHALTAGSHMFPLELPEKTASKVQSLIQQCLTAGQRAA